MNNDKDIPVSQPTESEAIVAAQRAPQTPDTLLLPPVPLPVDKAAALPPGVGIDLGALAVTPTLIPGAEKRAL